MLDDYHAGMSGQEAARKHGVSKGGLHTWASRLGRLKRDNPDAVYKVWERSAPPLPEPDLVKAERLARPLLGPLTADPRTASELCLEQAGLAAASGREQQALRWAEASRAFERALEARRAADGRLVRLGRAARGETAETAGPNPGEPWTPHAAQTPPDDDWRTWLFFGGRGAGKTRAGAEWLHARAEAAGGGRFALVGPSLHDVREVMIDGASGLRNLPGRERPRYEASRRRLVWSNDAAAYAYSAEDPESLRGPQHAAAWADEFCVWRGAGDTLALLRMGLRLGAEPRLVVTTTPRPIAALRRLMAEPGCAVSRAPTAFNADNLSPAFLDGLETLYGGTRLAAQELDGVLVEASEGALWRAEELARARGAPPDRFDRVVVAVDPPATAGGDACGMVVAGRRADRAYVLADLTASGLSPNAWGRRAADAAVEWGAAAIVAESNQGGDMVRAVLAAAAPSCRVELVHASRAKRARAEPVAALYEQGRVTHCAPLAALEEELMALGGADEGPKASPDRADALVWALTALMLDAPVPHPRIRAL